MTKQVESLFDFYPDSETNKAQQDILREIYAQHKIDYDKLKRELQLYGPKSLEKYGITLLSQVELHKWTLENAAIRGRTQGFTVFGLLRMMIDFRLRIDKK